MGSPIKSNYCDVTQTKASYISRSGIFSKTQARIRGFRSNSKESTNDANSQHQARDDKVKNSQSLATEKIAFGVILQITSLFFVISNRRHILNLYFFHNFFFLSVTLQSLKVKKFKF